MASRSEVKPLNPGVQGYALGLAGPASAGEKTKSVEDTKVSAATKNESEKARVRSWRRRGKREGGKSGRWKDETGSGSGGGGGGGSGRVGPGFTVCGLTHATTAAGWAGFGGDGGGFPALALLRIQ